MRVRPSRLPSTKSRASEAPVRARLARSLANTSSTRRFDQTRASSAVASPKRAPRAASSVPLIAPAEAPAITANGDGRARSAGSSPSRFRTPA